MLQQRDTADFKWGSKTGVGRINKEIKFYESFTSGGVEYRLFDCAYFYQTGDCETSIGKLIKMFETPEGEKKVRIVWFFRPHEIRDFLGGYDPRCNELFLASGDGPGLSNINVVEAIIQKCTVLCTSCDPRNPQPSGDELRMADYVFSRTFDVRQSIISGAFGNEIAGTKVEHFFNKIKYKKLISRPSSNPVLDSSDSSGNAFPSGQASTQSSDNRKLTGLQLREGAGQSHKQKLIPDLDPGSRDRASDNVMASNNTFACQFNLKTKTRSLEDLVGSGASEILQIPKKTKLLSNKSAIVESDDSTPQSSEQRINGTNLESPKNPDTPFEDRLKTAKEEGTLVLMENLDPSFTSLDIKEMCWQAFHERVDAMMIQSSLVSGPRNGKAFVIFKSKGAAESALSVLTERCLMLADGKLLLPRHTACNPTATTSNTKKETSRGGGDHTLKGADWEYL
ncbi:PREDICTED: protein ANTI-SILENCING 1 isoform X2 [Tarenaya hassleriana]|uniref:protein ANTI-SILENCING 1 isoform X2 n=1 Tax=Tarenaya hassleriana TaxID=28532 RepID=UPI00053C7984|nr:PREDICTED: protein ANTI-SILENCING 1 isoform X2 [Tarenaya hassleriana]